MISRRAFILAVDLPPWLIADNQRRWQERWRREQGHPLAANARPTINHLYRWWNAHVRGRGPGEALQRLRTLLLSGLIVISALGGSGAAWALLAYDGTEPINLAPLLAVFVALQGLLAGLSLALALVPVAPRLTGNTLQWLREVSPGGILQAQLQRQLAPGSRLSVSFARWQALFWSQGAAVAFNIGALLTMLGLMATTDLAFAWRTTLPVSDQALTQVVNAIALPWAGGIPAGVPGPDQIAASRFSRTIGSASLDPEVLRSWWLFVVLAVACWGLLPRLLLAGVAAVGLRRAAASMVLADPEVQALIARMRIPAGEHTGTSTEPLPVPSNPPAPPIHLTPAPAVAVIWGEVVTTAEATERIVATLGIAPGSLLHAGGRSTVSEDERTLEQIRASAPSTIVILARGWEPPLLEQLDFARGAISGSPGAQALFLPLAGATPLTAGERQAWQDAVARAGAVRIGIEFAP